MSRRKVYLGSILEVMTYPVLLGYPAYPFEQLAFLFSFQMHWKLCLRDFFPPKATPKHKSGGIFLFNAMLGIIRAPVWRDSAGPRGCKVFIKGACAQPGCQSAGVPVWSGPSEWQSPALFSSRGSPCAHHNWFFNHYFGCVFLYPPLL